MSFTASNRERREPAVPLAGFIDILFLLLVFFMTASVFRQKEQQIDVSLPSANETTSAGDRTQIVITIKADGSLFMTGATYDLSGLREKLMELATQFPNEAVVIRGDRTASYGQVVQVLDAVKAAKLKHTFLATTKSGSEL